MSFKSYEPRDGELSPEVVQPSSLETALSPAVRYSQFRYPLDPSQRDSSSGYPTESTVKDTTSAAGSDDTQKRESVEHVGGSGRNHKLGLIAFGAALAAIVIGAIVGGGVGAQLAHCRSELHVDRVVIAGNGSSSPTATEGSPSTATGQALFNYVPATPKTVNTTKLDCPSLNKKTYTATMDRAVFSLQCGVFVPAGIPSLEDPQKNITDIIATIAYTYEDCIEACLSYSLVQAYWNSDLRCLSVSYQTNMAWTLSWGAANCWLKNGTVEDGTYIVAGDANYTTDGVMTAKRVK